VGIDLGPKIYGHFGTGAEVSGHHMEHSNVTLRKAKVYASRSLHFSGILMAQLASKFLSFCEFWDWQ